MIDFLTGSWLVWKTEDHDDAGPVLKAKSGKYEVCIWEAEGAWQIEFVGTAKTKSMAYKLGKCLMNAARHFEKENNGK